MAVAALKLPRTYREEVRVLFEKRSERMVELLSSAPGFEPFIPRGAFYIFCDIQKTGLPSEIFCDRLLEEAHVAVIPGKSFGSDRHVRFSFAASEKDIEEGVQRVISWSKKAKP